jgi:hypothetical protein
MKRVPVLSGLPRPHPQDHGLSPRVRRAAAWAPFAIACAITLALALAARTPQRLPEAGEAERREAFRAIASDEAHMRSDAADAFPCDLWSRDDDFHRRELDRAREWSKQHRVRLGDVLAAIDEGLHSHWPHDASPLTASVPPCRPRAVY